MTPEQRERLLALKKRKKDELQALGFAKRAIKPCLAVLAELKLKEVHTDKIVLLQPQEDWQPILENIFREEPFSKFDLLAMEQKKSCPLLDAFFEKYPSVNHFRYVPDFPEISKHLRFKDIIEQYQLSGETVYLYYLRYPFVFQLPIAELVKAEEDELFNSYHDDVVIFPENLDWLLAYSLEEEWRFGK